MREMSRKKEEMMGGGVERKTGEREGQTDGSVKCNIDYCYDYSRITFSSSRQ